MAGQLPFRFEMANIQLDSPSKTLQSLKPWPPKTRFYFPHNPGRKSASSPNADKPQFLNSLSVHTPYSHRRALHIEEDRNSCFAGHSCPEPTFLPPTHSWDDTATESHFDLIGRLATFCFHLWHIPAFCVGGFFYFHPDPIPRSELYPFGPLTNVLQCPIMPFPIFCLSANVYTSSMKRCHDTVIVVVASLQLGPSIRVSETGLLIRKKEVFKTLVVRLGAI
jgi:hypothetical protein